MIYVLAAGFGLLTTAWLVFFVASNRAGSARGMATAAALAVLPIIYFALPASVVPQPGAVARQWGILRSPADALILILVVGLVVGVGYLVAARSGLVAWLAARLDRPGS